MLAEQSFGAGAQGGQTLCLEPHGCGLRVCIPAVAGFVIAEAGTRVEESEGCNPVRMRKIEGK
jgi:hypothetical protein